MDNKNKASGNVEVTQNALESALTTTVSGNSNKTSHRNIKRLLFIALPVLLLIAGVTAYWFFTLRDTKTTPVVQPQTSNTGKVAPRFNAINAYLSYQNAEWYATPGAVIRIKNGDSPVYYTQGNGVPAGSPTALIAHNNKLWLSTQEGVATLKADGSGFETVETGAMVENAQLFHDEFANKLYMSTSKAFYKYDDSTKTWKAHHEDNTIPLDAQEGASIPVNASDFQANKDFIAAARRYSSKVWVYNKADSEWTLSDIGQNLMYIFKIDDQLFAMGQNNAYKSCADESNVTATLFYKLDKSGAWQPVTGLSSDKTRPRLDLAHHLKDPAVVLLGSLCDSNETVQYKASFKNDTLELKKNGILSEDLEYYDDGEQQKLINEIAKATGLSPFIRVMAADKDSNLIFSYAKTTNYSGFTGIEGLAIAKGSDFTQATEFKIANYKPYDALVPVICDGTLTYIFVGSYGSGHAGYRDGTWTKTQLLKLDASKTEQFIDLQNDVGEPRFACSKGKINWVGKDTVKQLDVASKAITAVNRNSAPVDAIQTQSVWALDNGDLWILIPNGTANASIPENTNTDLYYFVSATRSLNKVGTYPSVGLLGGDRNHVWLAESYPDRSYKVFQGVVIYDRAGKKTSKDMAFLRLGINLNGDGIIAKAGSTTDAYLGLPFSVIRSPLSGSDEPISKERVPIRKLHLGIDAEDIVYNNSGVFDAQHNTMWFNDDNLGSFAVDL